MKKLFFAGLTLMLICTSVHAQSSNAGTTVANFLKLGAGAPAIGMGNSQTSVISNSADAIYWNPAALSSLNKMAVSFMYSSYFEDMAYGWLGFGLPTSAGTFGLGVQYFTSGSIEGRDENGDLLSDFSPTDYAVYLSYANRVYFPNSSVLRYGANVKYISSKIENTATAFAVDAGVIYTLFDGITSFGAAIQNIGTKMKFNVEEEDLPLAFKLGASRIFFDNLLVSLDAIIPSDNNIFPAIGAQYTIPITPEANIALRAGYDGRQKDVPGFAGFDAGFGASFRDFSFDYAFSPYGDLGTAHRVSVGVKFGETFDEDALKKSQTTANASVAQEQKQAVSKPEQASFTPSQNKQQASNTTAQLQQADEDQLTDAATDDSSTSTDVTASAAAQAPVQTRPIQKSADDNRTYIAIADFLSQNISKSELNVYATMLKKALDENADYNASLSSQNLANATLVKSELVALFDKTGADEIITCSVVKNADRTLTFNINLYYKNITLKKYAITAQDSFRDVQSKLKGFAVSLSK
ncbi:PorV/PorQ family protein [Endomicrobium proavitum]|nr:PorV/PorQ family protein [Endomicrobium proavitum]